MLRKRHILIFLAVLAIGLFVEGLKSLRDLSAPAGDGLSGLVMKNMDVTPFHLTQEQLATRGPKIAIGSRGLRNSTQTDPQTKEQYDFSEGHRVAQGAAKKGAIETAGLKKDKKKKKSARGKGKDKKTKVSEMDYEKYPEKNEAPREDVTGGTTAPVAITAITPKNDQLPVSYEDWAKLVLGRPQPDNVRKLTEYFANGMVSADIFYALLQAMLAESDPAQHVLAVYAAGNIVNPRSFTFLIDVLKATSSAQAVSNANELIAAYRTLSNVMALKPVLGTATTEIGYVHVALNILEQSTRIFLENRSPSAVTPAGRGTLDPKALAARQARAKQIFTSFKPFLEQWLATHSGDAAVVTPAQQVLERIKNMAVVVADLNS